MPTRLRLATRRIIRTTIRRPLKKLCIIQITAKNRIIRKKTKQLTDTQKELLSTARRAGMAEIATSVLHNIGNVLNPAITSAIVIEEILNGSKINTFHKLTELIEKNTNNFASYVANDPKGKQIPEFLTQLDKALLEEYKNISEKVKILSNSHEHIRQTIALQQSYAGISGVKEPIVPSILVQDAMQFLGTSFKRHDIELIIENESLIPEVNIEKHKVMQIMVNLLKNARDALKTTKPGERRLKIRFEKNDNKDMLIQIIDNGIGISKQNLKKIFNFGFTTKNEGHGFGLHGCANIAKEMGGSLNAYSQGEEHGTTFNLTLPID